MKSIYWSLLGVVVLAGCHGDQSTAAGSKSAASAPAKYRIAVIPKGTTHEFWKSVHYGAAQAGKEFGAEILWQGPLQEKDREGQISLVQNFVTKAVDGICLAPNDSQAFVRPVKDAAEQGVPVVIFDSGLDDTSSIVSYVATDNRAGGQLAADEMARALSEKGNIVLLRYLPGSESTYEREEGFLEQLKKYPALKVLSSDQYSGDTPQSALDKAQQILSKYGDRIDGLFAVCEPNAAGTLRALEDAGLAGKIVFIGFDPNRRMVQALAEKKMRGIVVQDPVNMGYLAVKTMVEHLQQKPVEKRISTGEAIATPENMNEPKMKELLDPPVFAD
ncbi:MAG TPA: substrate-binding domain-containing protein [Pirellulales bacterium]|nr:substrate-binding domain-containing protein [Pirellulales bacterium]